MTVFCCVAIIVFGITFLTQADPITTSIGENISTNDLSVAGLLDVGGDSNLSGNVYVAGLLDVTGDAAIVGDLDVTGNSTIDGTLGVTGDSTLSGDVNVGGDLTVSGSTSFGDASFSGIDDILYVDGITYAQNSTGIQAAIDAVPATGGKIILPAGTYSITATVIIAKSNVLLEGVGESTKLVLANGVNASVLRVGDGASSYSNIKISSLQIDGNKANNAATSYGIYFQGAVAGTIEYPAMESVYIHDMYDAAVRITYSNKGIFKNNKLYNNGQAHGEGFLATDSSNCIFDGNIFQSNRDNPIYLFGGANNIISNNQIVSNGDYGFYIRDTSKVQIINNVMNSCIYGVEVYTSNNIQITGNAITGNQENGVRLYRSSYNIIKGNTFKDNGIATNAAYYDIYLTDDGATFSTYNVIEGNNIRATAANKTNYGIYENAAGDDYNTIQNNTINGPVAGSVRVIGAHTTISGNKTSSATEGLFDIVTSSGATQTVLLVTQNGTGDIVDFKDGASSVFKISDGGNVTMSGNLTTSSINNILYVDGTKYAQNSTGIQAAIDALPATGGKIMLPAGTYNVTATIIINKSNVTLEGVGDASKLYLVYGTNANVINVGTGYGTSAFSDISIMNLQLDGNRANNNSFEGIKFNSDISNSRIENCYIHDTYYNGIYVYNSSGNSFKGNRINNTTSGGIVISVGSKNIIESNKMVNIGGSAINIGGGANANNYNSIIGNYIEGSGQMFSYPGIYLAEGANNTVNGNVFYNNRCQAIYTYRTSYNTITSNTITGSSQSGNNTYSDIYLYSFSGAGPSTYNIVSDNTINATGATKSKYGIEESDANNDYNTIQNNIINGPVTGNIHTLGAHDTVSGNKTSSATEGLFDIVANSGATQTALSVTQNGAGNIADFKDGTTSVFTIADGGNVTMNARSFTQNAVSPVLKGVLSSGVDGANGVYVQGKYAYVANYEANSLAVVDISDPAHPVLTGTLTDHTNMYKAWAVYVFGKYAYVASAGADSLTIVDVSNPYAPSLAGTIMDSATLDYAMSVYVSGKYAYVASSGVDALTVVDVSNPAAPVVAGSLQDHTNLDYAASVYVQGKYAYVVSADANSISVVDVSNPSSPVLIGSLIDSSNLNSAFYVYVSGKYAYVAALDADALTIVDISNPAVPVLVGTLADSTNLHGILSVVVSGKYAYAVSEYSDSLAVIDISNPAMPVLSGLLTDHINLDEPWTVCVQGKYAYVAAYSSDRLTILELSGFDLPTANIGDLSVSTIDVTDNASIANDLYVGNGLNVGSAGIYSSGNIISSGNISTSGNLNVGGSIYQPVYGTDDGQVLNLDFSENVGPELFVDPGLEAWTSATNPTNWDESGVDATHLITQEASEKRSGAYAVKLEQSAAVSQNFFVSQIVAAEPSTTYQLSGYVKYTARTAGAAYLGVWDGVKWVDEGLDITGSGYQFVSINITTDATTDHLGLEAGITEETGASTVAYFDDLSLKKVSGKAYDKSSYANDGTIVGASYGDGKYGQGMRFDGRENYINAGTGASLTNLSNATWSMWVKLDNQTPGSFLYKSDNDGSRGWFMGINNDADIGLNVVSNGDLRRYTSDVPAAGTWFHFVATWNGNITDATSAHVYINGSEVAYTTSVNGVAPRNSDLDYPLYVGHGTGPLNYFNGALDNVRIYNRVLSADEIRTQYLGGTDSHSVAQTDKFRVVDNNNNTPLIVDASTSASTTLTVTQNGTGNIMDLKKETNSVFIVAGNGNVTMNALSFTQNAVNPVHKGAIFDAAGKYLSGAAGVFVQGKYAYVTSHSNDSLTVIDVSNPASPVDVGVIVDDATTALDGAYGIYVSGQYAYITSNVDNGVEIIDISNPTHPTHVGAIFDDDTTALAGAESIYVSGKYAYVASYYDDGVEILDISNPSSPAHVGAIYDDGTTALDGAQSIYVQGKYAYVASYEDSGMEILDISTPSSPTHVGAIFDSSDRRLNGAYSVYVSGRYAYVASSSNNAVQIIDVSDPANPVDVGAIIDDDDRELTGAQSIYVSGKYAYVSGYGDDGVEIVDISDPTNPVHAGAITDDGTTALDGAQSIFIQGTYAYVASFQDSGLEILQIAGFDIPSANIGDLNVGTLDVVDNANIANNLYVGNGLNVGIGGIYSAGDITTNGNLYVAGSIFQSVYGNDDGQVLNLDFSENVGSEMLLDTSLEQWTSSTDLTQYWEFGTDASHTVTQSSGEKRSGSYSVKLEQSAATVKTFGINQDVAVEPSTTYQVSGYVKYTSRTDGGVYVGGWDGINWASEYISANSSFQYMSFSITTSPTATYLGIEMAMTDETGASSVAYIDDLSIKKISGKAYDKSSYANDGTIVGASYGDGKYGQGMRFNGLDSNYVNAGTDSSLNIPGDLTVSTWVKYDSANEDQTILDNEQYDMHVRGDWAGRRTYFCTIINELADPGDSAWDYQACVVAPTEYEIGRWYNITGVRSGNTIKIYIDGVLVNQHIDLLSGYTPATSPDEMLIGQGVDGSLDNMRIYKRALSDDEIRAQYLQGTDSHSVMQTEKFRIVDMDNNTPFFVDASASGSTTLTVTQKGTGDIADFKDGGNSVFKISAAGNVTMNGLSFTQNAVSPVYVGSVINSSYMDSPFGIDYANNYAYVTGADSNSLSIIDVSKPASPVLVGSLVDGANMDYALDVKVVGKYAYVSGRGNSSLSIIDVSNPITPVLVGSVSDDTNLAGATGIYISGKYAYVANAYGSSMAIVDISNPAAPAVTGSLSDWQMDGAISIYVQGNYAYVAGYSSAVLSVIDISNPASPTGVGYVYSAAYMLGAYDVKVVGKYAYVVGFDSDSLAIVDISNPAVPAVVGHLVDSDNMAGPAFLDVSGKYAYVTADYSDSLSVVDISNPAAPVLSGLLADPTHMSEPTGITVSGKYAYVGSYNQDALAVLEIAGFDLPSANIGDLNVGTLDVTANANIANNLYVGNGLNVGVGGIYSIGDMFTGGNLSVAGSIYQPVYSNDDGLVMNLDFSENAGPELLIDPGVETWTSATNLTNWGEYGVDATHTITQESTDKRSGIYSVKLEQSAATAKEFTIEQDVAAEPNTTYQLNGYVKYASRTAGEVYISAWDGTNWKEEDLSAVTSSYQFVSLRFTTSATTDYIEFAVSMNGETGASAVAYLDDFSLKKIDTATVYDKSPYANDCAITNASFTNGKYGQGMQFDGILNNLNCGASDSLNFNGTKEFTIGFWTYLNGSTNMDFLSKFDWSGYNGYAVIRTTNDLVLAVGHGDSTYTEVDTPISSEGWHYVAYTATASELKGYMDGELRATTPLTKSIVYSSDAIYFGVPDWQANPLNASLDELRIYNRALPEDEIRTQYSGSADAHSVVRADQFRIIDMNNNIPFLVDASGDITMTGNLNVDGFITNLPATAISTEGLVGYWPLDGNVKDYSSGGNNGTNYDGVFTSSGKVGGAYTFDGSTSYIDAGTGLNFVDTVTVEAWVKVTTFAGNGGSSQRIVINRVDADNAYQLALDEETNGFMFQMNDNGDEYAKTVSGFDTGVWYHVVGTYDRTNRANLYVNSVAASEDTGGYGLGSANLFLMGKRSDDSGYLSGTLDEVRVYHRALSEAEVKQHYNADATLLQGESYIRKSGDSMYGGLDIVDNSISFSSYGGGLFDRITLTGDGDGTHLYCADNDSGDGIHFQNTAGLEQMFIDNATGNVGIGTIQPNPSAALDITSTTKGLLPPRLTTAQRDAISAPATGLLIYNTTTNKLNFYNGAAWEIVTSAP